MAILRYVLFGLAVLIAAAFGWRSAGMPHLPRWVQLLPVLTHAKTPPVKPTANKPALESASSAGVTFKRARAEIVDDLGAVPQFAIFYKELEAAFPHVYADFVDQATRAISNGGRGPTAGALIWDALRNLQQSNGILAAGADADALAMFFNARLAMLDVLATVDQRGCADFLYGATDPSIETFSDTHRDIVADLAAKQLAAIEDGQHKHLDPALPSSEDLDLVASGLAVKTLKPDEIAMLLDGKAMDPPLPDARLCEIGRTYLSVLKNLPPAVRQRVYGLAAELLARS